MLDEIIIDMKSRHAGILKEGDQFGEQAGMRDDIRTASIRCREGTDLAYILKKDFKKIYENI